MFELYHYTSLYFYLSPQVVSICLSPSSSVVFEDDGLISVQLVKSGQTQLPVTVILSTVDGTATGKFTID